MKRKATNGIGGHEQPSSIFRKKMKQRGTAYVSPNTVRKALNPFTVFLSAPPLLISDLFCYVERFTSEWEEGRALSSSFRFPLYNHASMFDYLNSKRISCSLEDILPVQVVEDLTTKLHHVEEHIQNNLDNGGNGVAMERKGERAVGMAKCRQTVRCVAAILCMSDNHLFEQYPGSLQYAGELKADVWWVSMLNTWVGSGHCANTDAYIDVAGGALILELFCRKVWARHTLYYLCGKDSQRDSLCKRDSGVMDGDDLESDTEDVRDGAAASMVDDSDGEGDSIEDGEDGEDNDEEQGEPGGHGGEQEPDDGEDIATDMSEMSEMSEGEMSDSDIEQDGIRFGSGVRSGGLAIDIPRAPCLFFPNVCIKDAIDEIESESFATMENKIAEIQEVCLTRKE